MARLMPHLFVLLVGVAVGTEVDLEKRIIGGRQCRQNERHYHVIVRGDNPANGRSSLCGGSLISSRWVLTAAHCYEQGWTMTAILGRHQGQMETMVIEAAPEIFRRRDTRNIMREHDIMLLKLPRATRITPVALPDCTRPPLLGAAVSIAGHGATTTGRNNRRIRGQSNTLQCAETNVVDCRGLRTCLQRDDPVFYESRRDQMWFCGQRCTVDTCPGDSGGGVVYNNMIFGVHSFTGDTRYACREAAGFMYVCGYLDWINGIINRPTTVLGKIGRLCSTCG